MVHLVACPNLQEVLCTRSPRPILSTLQLHLCQLYIKADRLERATFDIARPLQFAVVAQLPQAAALSRKRENVAFATRITSPGTGKPASMRNSAWMILCGLLCHLANSRGSSF